MTMARGFGGVSILLGGLAMMLVLYHFAAGPLTPQPSLADTIADTALALKDAMARAASGAPAPVAEPPGPDLDARLDLAKAMTGGLAIVLGAVAYALGGTRRVAGTGIALGAGAVMFQFVSWLAMLIAGVILLWAIMDNLGDLLGAVGLGE